MSALALTFDYLLRLEGIDPMSVVLVRHQDAACQTRTLSLYRLWKDGSGVLEAYEAIQHRRVFEPRQLVASFVVTPTRRTRRCSSVFIQSTMWAPHLRARWIQSSATTSRECPVHLEAR
jgi:hypothetical protein